MTKKITQIVAARLPREVVRGIEEIAREERLDKSSVIVRAADAYVKHWRLERALRLYSEGRISALKAAACSGLSIWAFIEELEKRKIIQQYSAEQFIEDFEAARKE